MQKRIKNKDFKKEGAMTAIKPRPTTARVQRRPPNARREQNHTQGVTGTNGSNKKQAHARDTHTSASKEDNHTQKKSETTAAAKKNKKTGRVQAIRTLDPRTGVGHPQVLHLALQQANTARQVLQPLGNRLRVLRRGG